MKTTNRLILAAATAASALIVAAPASAQGRWDWAPGDRPYRLARPGEAMLFPELRGTPRGRAFVMRNFDFNRDGYIDRREADAADRAFAEVAGPDRARFNWDRYGPGRVVREEVVVVDRGGPGGPGSGHWDRGAMRDYHFRQTPEGARMTLQEDVLFQTDSAVLRPHAIDKLQALAGYLKDNPGVRVSIDGFTDSRGTDAHNQDLSERRAESVRAAFDDLGVVRARFRVRGHGKADPVATNATAAGMRLNRRVEVTLLGQRADSFDR
jgi:outer membrane protein OmpA-like peptidoglycan-associated protein